MVEHNGCRQSEGECIQRKAYEFWEKDGCNHGRELQYWLKAEHAIKNQINNNGSKKRGIKGYQK